MQIPTELRIAIADEVGSRPIKAIGAAASRLSRSYRGGMPPGEGKHLHSYEDVLAYAAFRMPATFAAIYAALHQITDRSPNLKPRSLLDAGAGPGTGMWAASILWPDLEHITLLERDEDAIDLGRRIASRSLSIAVQKADWVKTDLEKTWPVPPHDLVIASYALNELPQNTRTAIIQQLWQSTGSVLVIVEPGTPQGFLLIKQARELLLQAGARTMAPCPHDKTCPMEERDWCHFSRRVARTQLHRQAKAGELSYEDEKFSFLAMSRTSGEAIKGLVIRHPQIRKGHIHLKLCTPDGLTDAIITHKDKGLFRKARDLRWGSIYD